MSRNTKKYLIIGFILVSIYAIHNKEVNSEKLAEINELKDKYNHPTMQFHFRSAFKDNKISYGDYYFLKYEAEKHPSWAIKD